MRLELLHRLARVVDEREARTLAAAVLCPEAEARDLVLGGLVERGELVAEFVFGDVRAAGVEDVAVRSELSVIILLFACLVRLLFSCSCCRGGGGRGFTHTTICLRPSRGLRMNLRVRRVTWPSDMITVDAAEVCGGLLMRERSPGGFFNVVGVARRWTEIRFCGGGCSRSEVLALHL